MKPVIKQYNDMDSKVWDDFVYNCRGGYAYYLMMSLLWIGGLMIRIGLFASLMKKMGKLFLLQCYI